LVESFAVGIDHLASSVFEVGAVAASDTDSFFPFSTERIIVSVLLGGLRCQDALSISDLVTRVALSAALFSVEISAVRVNFYTDSLTVHPGTMGTFQAA
jgi:hypothetical protein